MNFAVAQGNQYFIVNGGDQAGKERDKCLVTATRRAIACIFSKIDYYWVVFTNYCIEHK